MGERMKILNAVKVLCGTLLAFGMVLMVFGFMGNESSSLTGIGIGTVVGAVMIFLMGIFFVATEEWLEQADNRG